jgi:hypothetical protein
MKIEMVDVRYGKLRNGEMEKCANRGMGQQSVRATAFLSLGAAISRSGRLGAVSGVLTCCYLDFVPLASAIPTWQISGFCTQIKAGDILRAENACLLGYLIISDLFDAVCFALARESGRPDLGPGLISRSPENGA